MIQNVSLDTGYKLDTSVNSKSIDTHRCLFNEEKQMLTISHCVRDIYAQGPTRILLLSEVHEFDIQSNPGIVIMISNDKIARLWFLNNK